MKLFKFFTRGQLRLLLEILEKGEITTTSQKTFPIRYSFYMAIKPMNDRGFVVQNGITDSRQYIWALTERGKELALHLKEIEGLL